MLLFAVVTYSVPAIGIGGLGGGLAGAATAWSLDDARSRRRWRPHALRALAYGVVLVATYYATLVPIGADREARRFDRNWSLGDSDPAVFIQHPWAWLPLAIGIAAVSWGAIVWWRSR